MISIIENFFLNTNINYIIDTLEVELINEKDKNENSIKLSNILSNEVKRIKKLYNDFKNFSNEEKNKFQIQINDENYKNNYFVDRIENLEIQLIIERNNNEELVKLNKKLEEENKKLKNDFDNFKKNEEKKTHQLQTQINDLNKKIEKLEKDLAEEKLKNEQLQKELNVEKKNLKKLKIIMIIK